MVEKISKEVGQIFLLSDQLLFGKTDVVFSLYLKLDLRELWADKLLEDTFDLLLALLYSLSVVGSLILSLVGFPL